LGSSLLKRDKKISVQDSFVAKRVGLEKCIYCGSFNTIKRGFKRNRFQCFQRFQCKNCGRIFTRQKLKNKSYTPKVILSALSLYNSGFTLKETAKKINKRFALSLKPQTIHVWLNAFSELCSFGRLRKNALKLFPPGDMILRKRLEHKQVYEFQLHRAKLELLKGELPELKFFVLKSYLESVFGRNFPHHIFRVRDKELEQRASRIKGDLLEAKGLEKKNLANKLAELALTACPNNKARHSFVQNFMLANDSCTIACEVPVYLTNDDIVYFKRKGFEFDFENYRTPITGHIDLLQIRNGCIHILDYKPEAEKLKPVEQLVVYALALASRTKLAVKDFKCAWFDEKHYFEFFPLHAVYSRN
jgi:transposase-like protein